MIYTEQTRTGLRLLYCAMKDRIAQEGMPELVDWIIIANLMPDEITTATALLYGAVNTGVFELEYVKQLQVFHEDVIYALEILLLHKVLGYKEYLQQVKSCPIAYTVKHAQLKHKGTPGRLEETPLNRKYLDRYWRGQFELEDMFCAPVYCKRPVHEERLLRNSRYRDNIRGCMLGTAIGDSVGYHPCGISSNTQLCCATAFALLRAQAHFATVGFNYKEIDFVYRTYLDWAERQIGKQKRPKTWLTEIPAFCERRDPDDACVSLLNSGRYSSMRAPIGENKSWSCLARVAPIALLYKNTDSRNDHIKHEMRMAASVAALTHGHPIAWLSAALWVHSVSRTIYGGCVFSDSLYMYIKEGKQLLYEMFGYDTHLEALFAVINKAISLAADDEQDDHNNIVKIGSGYNAHECLAIAIYCALRYPMNFNKAVLAAANHPGNTAATACLTGQIMGVKLGYNRLDTSEIEAYDAILELADDLVDQMDCDDPKWRSKYQCDFAL